MSPNVCQRENAHRDLDILPLSPHLHPQVIRTPTPPWAMSMEVAGRENGVADVANERPAPSGEGPWASRKPKRVRVRLDTRIELTDEELKVLSCFGHALCAL